MALKSTKSIIQDALTIFRQKLLRDIPVQNDSKHALSLAGAYNLMNNRRQRRNITNDLANLSAAVAEQDLGKYGYAIGDYFDGGWTGYKYTLADLDTFFGGYNAYSVIGTHHITIVVDTKKDVQWNTSNDASIGYYKSNLHIYLSGIVRNNVMSDFNSLFGSSSSHLIAHQKLYSHGTSSWAWSKDQYISALTSVQLHGAAICDMNFYHTGEGNKPLEVFQKFFYPEIFGNQTIWLRSVASASCPVGAGYDGNAFGTSGASTSFRAVGLIIFH